MYLYLFCTNHRDMPRGAEEGGKGFFTLLKYFNENFYSINKIVICKFENETKCQERISNF